MISLYSCGIEERAVNFSVDSGKACGNVSLIFRYPTTRVVLERIKGGGKRLESRKAVYNAIVPRTKRVRVLESFGNFFGLQR